MSHVCNRLTANAPRLPWILLALTLGALGLAACQREQPVESPNAAVPAVPSKHFDAHLSLVNNNHQIRYDGVVDSEASKQQLLHALNTAYGPDSIAGQLSIDAQARKPAWVDGFAKFAEIFTMPGAAVRFEGEQIELSGRVSPEQRLALLAKVQALYPGYDYAGLLQGVGVSGTPTDPAVQALVSLGPEAFPRQVVVALNRMQVTFEPGTARIHPASLDILSHAAQAIAATPAGARFQLEASADDPTLARQRAEAVKVQLILNGASPAAIQTASGAGAEELTFSLAAQETP